MSTLKKLVINFLGIRNDTQRQQIGNNWTDVINPTTGKRVPNPQRVTVKVAGHVTKKAALVKLASLTTAQLSAINDAVCTQNSLQSRLTLPDWATDSQSWTAVTNQSGEFVRHFTGDDGTKLTYLTYTTRLPIKAAAVTL